ncbi:MAG: hypothetical protein ABIJ09_22985 [Pseudomonadota bacterium]
MPRLCLPTRALTALSLVLLPFAACECDEIGDLSALGALEPATHNFGPVVSGERCVAQISLRNDGQADLTVNESKFVDSSGNFAIDGIVPAFVSAFSSDVVAVAYTAGTPGTTSEGATLWLKTNTPENDGVLQAALRGTPVAGLSAMVGSSCDVDGTATAPCSDLNFGATVVATTSPGVLRTVRIHNDGTSTMTVVEPVVLDNADFTLDSARVPSADGLGGLVEVTQWPLQLEPGKGQCGVDSGNAVTFVELSVRYLPTDIGADAGRLRVDTDAAITPSYVEVGLVGIGSGDGIATDPDFVNFGEVAVGQSSTKSVRVFNLRLDQARINNSCLDTNRDDVCDIDCTAINDQAVLSCGVEKSDGSHEGKGFVLEPADAMAGGDDERTVKIRWAPDAPGALRAQLLLDTVLGGGRVWKVLVNGGVAGTFTPSSDPVVVVASGTPLAGQASFTVTNTGAAPLTIRQVNFAGSSSITGEFTLTRAGDGSFSVNGTTPWTGTLTLQQNQSESFTLDYLNSGVVNCDSFDVHWFHDGDGQDPYILGVEVDGDNC